MMIYSSDKDNFFTRNFPAKEKLRRGMAIAILRIVQNKHQVDTTTSMNTIFFKALGPKMLNTWLTKHPQQKESRLVKSKDGKTLRLTTIGHQEVTISLQPKTKESRKNNETAKRIPRTDETTVIQMIDSILNGTNFMDVTSGEIFEFTKRIKK